MIAMTSPAQDRLPTPQLGQLHHQRKWTELHFGKWIFLGGKQVWLAQPRKRQALAQKPQGCNNYSFFGDELTSTHSNIILDTNSRTSLKSDQRGFFLVCFLHNIALLFLLRDRKISQKGLVFLGHHLVTIFSNSTSLENNLDWTSCPKTLTTQIGNALSLIHL